MRPAGARAGRPRESRGLRAPGTSADRRTRWRRGSLHERSRPWPDCGPRPRRRSCPAAGRHAPPRGPSGRRARRVPGDDGNHRARGDQHQDGGNQPEHPPFERGPPPAATGAPRRCGNRRGLREPGRVSRAGWGPGHWAAGSWPGGGFGAGSDFGAGGGFADGSGSRTAGPWQPAVASLSAVASLAAVDLFADGSGLADGSPRRWFRGRWGAHGAPAVLDRGPRWSAGPRRPERRSTEPRLPQAGPHRPGRIRPGFRTRNVRARAAPGRGFRARACPGRDGLPRAHAGLPRARLPRPPGAAAPARPTGLAAAAAAPSALRWHPVPASAGRAAAPRAGQAPGDSRPADRRRPMAAASGRLRRGRLRRGRLPSRRRRVVGTRHSPWQRRTAALFAHAANPHREPNGMTRPP